MAIDHGNTRKNRKAMKEVLKFYVKNENNLSPRNMRKHIIIANAVLDAKVFNELSEAKMAGGVSKVDATLITGTVMKSKDAQKVDKKRDAELDD